MIPLMGNVQNRQIHRHRVGSWLLGEGRGTGVPSEVTRMFWIQIRWWLDILVKV